MLIVFLLSEVAICTGRVEAKIDSSFVISKLGMLQSARGVWRQRQLITAKFRHLLVAICTGRVEAKDLSCAS